MSDIEGVRIMGRRKGETWQARFERHYARGEPDECWPWLSSKKESGYGRFRLNGRSITASRIAYEIANGAVPEGQSVCHSCDNPACVNPGHLFLASHAENMLDRNAKGRARGGSSRGEKHPGAKLTTQQSLEIRALAREGAMPQAEIGRRFGIAQSQVSQIKNGRSW